MVSIQSLQLPFFGGLLIGLAALLLYAALGRIAGISGIAYSALWGEQSQRGWRWLFLLGLVAGGWLALLGGIALPAAQWPEGLAGKVLLVGAGLLVGFGTQLGSGCTSGHGICGLARLSPRSLVAVLVFMAFGVLAANLLRPLWS